MTGEFRLQDLGPILVLEQGDVGLTDGRSEPALVLGLVKLALCLKIRQ